MKALKLLTLLTVFGLMFFNVSLAKAHSLSSKKQSKDFRSWKITMSRSGGYAGMLKSYTLDSKGNLTHRDRAKETVEKISKDDVEEIGKMIQRLKLPNTKLKTVKGKRIYDGVYSNFIITLNGKNYNIEGNSFYDAKYLALTERQKEVLGRLYEKLKEVGANGS